MSLFVRATAPVAAVDGHVFPPDSDVMCSIVRVGVSDAVRTDALHHAGIVAPVQRPRSHAVVGWVVDAAMFPAALSFIVRFK